MEFVRKDISEKNDISMKYRLSYELHFSLVPSRLSILEYIHWIFEPLSGNDIKTLRQNLQNVISRRPSMTEENLFRAKEPYFFHVKKK